MFKKLGNKKLVKNEKGLTLIELLAVIVILAIIAAIAVPAIGNIIESSRVKAAKADAANVLSAANIYFTENPGASTFTATATEGSALIYQSYIADLGTITSFTVTKNTTGNTIVAAGTSNGKNYNIASTTLKDLKVDNGKAASDDKFSWSSTTP